MRSAETILKDYNIRLIPADFKLTLESLRSKTMAPRGDVLVCDTSINEHKNGASVKIPGIDRHPETEFIGFGYRIRDRYGMIYNIDHHFNGPEFERTISSTNLASGYVRNNCPLKAEVTAVINHLDCDSLLSVLIMLGILAPEKLFEEAAIAADHTGAEHPLADLLQAFEGERDLEFSIDSLFRYLAGETPDPRALSLLEKREKERRLAKQIIFKFVQTDRIAYATTNVRVDGSLLVALLPDTEFIVLECPRSMKDDSGRPIPGNQIKVRLGYAAKEGTNLQKIIPLFDQGFSGRWNAGSNNRSMNSSMPIDEFIKHLCLHCQ